MACSSPSRFLIDLADASTVNRRSKELNATAASRAAICIERSRMTA